MCTIAPFALPNLGGADMMKMTMATSYAEVAPAAAVRGRDYGMDYNAADDIDALLWDIDAVVRPRTPAAAYAYLPMPPLPPPPEFLARSRRDNYHHNYDSDDFDLEAVLRRIPSVRVRIPTAAGLFAPPVPVVSSDAAGASPRTPPAAVVLTGPLSYGGDDDADAVTIKKTSQQLLPRYDYDYDAEIDATFRDMEADTMERPSPDYLSDRQAGTMMMMADRADLVKKMHGFCTLYDLAPGALHRAVSFVDRFLSAKKISGGEREMRVLGAVAVFAAAKYEDRGTLLRIHADHVAEYAGCTRADAVDKERELVATLGYRLSGPTAYTFVDHFMRRRHGEEEKAVRDLAHHLADMALLDYRCVALVPSAVAAAAILLARMALCYPTTPVVVASYTLEELSDCVQAIYDLHENLQVWPGCAEMIRHWESTAQFPYYALPPCPC